MRHPFTPDGVLRARAPERKTREMTPADPTMASSAAAFPSGQEAMAAQVVFIQPPSYLPLRIGRLLLAVGVFLSGHAVLKIAGLNLTVADVALFFAAAILLGQRRFNMAPFGQMTPIWLLGLGAMLGGLFVSSAVNGDLLRWLDIGSQYGVAFYLVPVLLMAVDTRFARKLIVIYLFGIVASEIVGILSYFFLKPSDTAFLSPGFIAPNGRIGAMAGEPNPNGATVAFALAMVLYSWRTGLLKFKLVVVVALILLWGLLLSASATGAIAAVVSVCTVLALTGFGRLVKVAFVVITLGALYVGSGAPIPHAFEKRVGTPIVTGQVQNAGTFEGRAELIREAWEQTGDHVFLGMGADKFRDFSPEGQPVHNLHLLIWDEGGALAYLGLLLMLCLLVILALAALREKREEAAMALAVVFVFLIYTISIPHMYSRFWVLPVILALSTIYGRGSSGTLMGRGTLIPANS